MFLKSNILNRSLTLFKKNNVYINIELLINNYFIFLRMFEKDQKKRISSEEVYAELVKIKSSLNSDIIIG